ncbi:MAG TPA: hypothetical protein VHK24_07465, partial [Steroidobacter sp.]|nr:hypothetical protein [Steroidobacter sp.]
MATVSPADSGVAGPGAATLAAAALALACAAGCATGDSGGAGVAAGEAGVAGATAEALIASVPTPLGPAAANAGVP